MKKILAVGCSHGIYADPTATAAVLRFKRDFKPDTTIHLGDAVDVTCLRSGAPGTPDESAELAPDIASARDFLEQLEPNYYLWGNHEDRLSRLCCDRREIVRYTASQIVAALNDTCHRLKCQVKAYTGNYQGIVFGGVRYMHGTAFNESSVRDHAEMFGPVVFAHTHRAGMATGRRCDSPIGFCVGTLTKRENMDYAKTRRSTLGWSQGFVWGYYNDKHSQLWLHEQPKDASGWTLPR